MEEPHAVMTTLPLDRIIPYPRNPRNNDNAVHVVYNSIRKFGYVSEIKVNQDGVILAGHTRLRALKQLYEDGEFEKGRLKEQGLTADAIPVKMLRFRDENEENEYRLADNKTAEEAGWDWDVLDEIIAEIKDTCDLSDYGFKFDLWDGEGAEVDEDEVVERAPSPKGGKPEGLFGPAYDSPEPYSPAESVQPEDIVFMGPHVLRCSPFVHEDCDALLAGEPFLAVVSTACPFDADVVGWAFSHSAVLRIGDMSDDGRRAFLRSITGFGNEISETLSWEHPQAEGPEGDYVRHASDSILVYGEPPSPKAVGDGVCREPLMAGLYSWLVGACSKEGGLVVDLTGAERDMVGICDALGRRCLSFCADPSACDSILTSYIEAHGPSECLIERDGERIKVSDGVSDA